MRLHRGGLALLLSCGTITGSMRFAYDLPAPPRRTARWGGLQAHDPKPALWGGLSAKDFGAVGDGQADDGPALQRAISAALEQGRTLLLPAGHYLVNATLSIASSARQGYAVPGPGYAKHPLRLVGEGGALSAIVAGSPMHAVLNFSANNSAAYGAAAPEPTEMQYLGDVSIDGEHDRLRSTSRAAAFSRRDAVCVACHRRGVGELLGLCPRDRPLALRACLHQRCQIRRAQHRLRCVAFRLLLPLLLLLPLILLVLLLLRIVLVLLLLLLLLLREL
eukprot:COSAG04_NODE_4588_length_2003_cov_2.347689_1_plen_277_part_00